MTQTFFYKKYKSFYNKSVYKVRVAKTPSEIEELKGKGFKETSKQRYDDLYQRYYSDEGRARVRKDIQERHQAEYIEKKQQDAKDADRQKRIKAVESVGMEVTEKNIENVKFVSPEVYKKITTKQNIFRNTPDMQPVIMDDKIYWKKKDAVNQAVNEEMSPFVDRVNIIQELETKKRRAKFKEQLENETRERMTKSWTDKKEKQAQEENTSPAYLLFHPEESYTPERNKSAQETMDVSSPVDYKQFANIDHTIPNMDQSKDADQAQSAYEKTQAEKIDLINAKSSLSWDWHHPIDSARRESETWGMEIDMRKRNLQDPLKGYEDRSSTAIKGMIELSGSSESISPSEYSYQMSNYENEVKASDIGIKAPVVMVAGVALASIAKGAKNVIIDVPLHPLRTYVDFVTMPFNAPEIIASEAKEIINDPIGAPVQLATELWTFGKLSEGVMRLAKPKITETPVKGRSVKSLETTRINAEGKVFKDQQIQIETELGKPKERFFWEKSKVKPRESINIEFERKTRSNFKGSEVLEGTSQGKGKITFKDQSTKARLTKRSIIESEPPKKVLDLEQGMTGKTGTGVKLSGKTGKLIEKPGIAETVKTRKAHTRTIPDKVEGIYKEGEFITITEKGKSIDVKASSKLEITPTQPKTFRSKGFGSGDLILEEQMSGQFVKRQYNKKPQDPGSFNRPQPPKDPDFVLEFDRKGNIKQFDDMRNIQTLESGKQIKIGKKPVSPDMEKLSKAIDELYNKEFQKVGSKVGSRQKVVTESLKQGKKAQDKPIIDVITQDAEVKGVSMPLFTTKGETMSQKGKSFLPKVRQELLSKEDKLTNQKDEYMTIGILKEYEDHGFEPIFDINTNQRQRSLKGSIFGDRSETLTDETLINDEVQIIEPVIEIKEKQSEDQIIAPIQAQSTHQTTTQIFEFDELIDTIDKKKEDRLIKKGKKDKDLFDDDFLLGFDLFVKSKGKFGKINKKGSLSKDEALMMGADIVENSPSATFKLIESNAPLAMGTKTRLKDKLLLDQFYEKGDNTYIERSRYRINTPGEVAGISRLGHLAKQTKSFIEDAQVKLPKMMDEFAVPSMAGNHKTKRGKADDLFGGIKW